MSAKLSAMLTPALEYAERKFYVFPCHPRSKKPATPHAFLDASIDPEQVKRCWAQWPEANIALACAMSNILVIDIDVPGPSHPGLKVSGEVALAGLEAKLGKLPVTCEAQTPTGGRHLFFIVPPDEKFKTILAVGVDAKHNGFVMLAPSISPDTNTPWVWVRSLLDQMPAMLPEAWLAFACKLTEQAEPVSTATRLPVTDSDGCTPYGRKARDEDLEELRTAPETTRNDTTNKVSFNLGRLHAGRQIGDVREAIVAAAMATGLPDAEARKTTESGWNAGLKTPRTAPPLPTRPTVRQAAPVIDMASAEPWGALKPLADDLLPVPAFNEQLLPESLHDWAMDSIERMQCPPEFFAAPAMVSASALIGRTVTTRPKRHDSYTVVPNCWGVSVGDPGTFKTPGQEAASKPLRKVQADYRAEYEQAMVQHERMSMIRVAEKSIIQDMVKKQLKAGKSKEQIAAELSEAEAAEPVFRQIIVNDATPEALADAIAQNPRGIAVFRDELSGLWKAFGREGHESERSLYLEGANGNGEVSIRRVKRGLIYIKGLCIAHYGTVQPCVLTQFAREISAAADGFLQRYGLLVYPDVPAWRHVDRAPDRTARDRADEVFRRLDKLTAASVGAVSEYDDLPYLRYADDAQELADDWIGHLMAKARDTSLDRALRSHLDKYPRLQPALALVCHLIDVVDGAQQRADRVSADAVKRSIAWCEHLAAHAARVYDALSTSSVQRARTLLAKIRAGKLTSPFSLRDVYHRDWSGLEDLASVEKAVGCLAGGGYVREVEIATNTKPCHIWHVNPAVFAQSAEMGALGAVLGRDMGVKRSTADPEEKRSPLCDPVSGPLSLPETAPTPPISTQSNRKVAEV